MNLKYLLAPFCLAALLTSHSYAAEASYDYEVVAQSGTKIDGIILTYFDQVAFNDAGTVVFLAGYNDGSYAGAAGIFTRKHVLLKKGDVVRGLTINSPSLRSINDFNELLVEFPDGNGLSDALGKFVMHGDSVVLEGKLIKTADVIDGLTIQSFRESFVNDMGEVVFSANYTDASGGGGVGVFTHDRVLLKVGSVVDGVTLSGNNYFNTLYGVSDFKEIVFDTFGSPNLGFSLTGAFTQHKVLALPGDKIDNIPLLTAFSPAISRFGKVAFAGEYAITSNCSSYQCMGFAVLGPHGVVAKTGDTISGVTFSNSVTPISINDAGDVLMQANFGGGYGLFTKDAVVAATGDTLAGFQVEGFVNAQINESGDVAFSAFEGILLAKHRSDCKRHR